MEQGSSGQLLCGLVKLHPSPKERLQRPQQLPGQKNGLQACPNLLSLLYWRKKGQCQPWPEAIFIGFLLLALRPTQSVLRPSNRPQRDLQINLGQVLKLVSKRPSLGASARPWRDPSIGLGQSTDLHQEASASDPKFPQRHARKRAGTGHCQHLPPVPMMAVPPGPSGVWAVVMGPKAWLGADRACWWLPA